MKSGNAEQDVVCRFAVPKGLLGHSYSNPLDLPRPQEKQPSDTDIGMQWVLHDENLFSTSTQLYLCRTVQTGSLPSEASDGHLVASQLLDCQHMSEPCQLCTLGTLGLCRSCERAVLCTAMHEDLPARPPLAPPHLLAPSIRQCFASDSASLCRCTWPDMGVQVPELHTEQHQVAAGASPAEGHL